jgi:hypothetical protein
MRVQVLFSKSTIYYSYEEAKYYNQTKSFSTFQHYIKIKIFASCATYKLQKS